MFHVLIILLSVQLEKVLICFKVVVHVAVEGGLQGEAGDKFAVYFRYSDIAETGHFLDVASLDIDLVGKLRPALVTSHASNLPLDSVGRTSLSFGAGVLGKRPTRVSRTMGHATYVCIECGIPFKNPQELADHVMCHNLEPERNPLRETQKEILQVERAKVIE